MFTIIAITPKKEKRYIRRTFLKDIHHIVTMLLYPFFFFSANISSVGRAQNQVCLRDLKIKESILRSSQSTR